MKMRRELLCAASCLVLVGCGGGGGGSPDLTIAPSNQNTSIPTPTLTGLTSQSLVNDATFLSGVTSSATTVASSISAGPQSLTVQYDAGSGGYAISTSGGSQTFLPSNIQSSSTANTTVYEKTTGSSTDDTLSLVAVPLSSGQNYAGLGFWIHETVNGNSESATYNSFTYGFPTTATAVPRTGGAAYNTLMFGLMGSTSQPLRAVSGNGTLNVDFASGLLAVSMTGNETVTYPSSATITGGAFQANAQLSSGDGTFAGSANYSATVGSFSGNAHSAFLSGPLSGRFYGPTAQQLGASFYLTDGVGDDLAGSLLGNQAGAATTNLTLTDVITTQTFTTAGARVFSTVPGAIAQVQDQLTLPAAAATGVTYAPVGGSGTATFAPSDAVASSNPNFTAYQQTTAGTTSQLALYKPGSSNTELALTYTGFGSWQQTQASGFNQTYFVYGLPTTASALQARTGSAIYTGVAYGTAINTGTNATQSLTGTSVFNMNFVNKSMVGSITLSSFGTFAVTAPFGVGSTNQFTTLTLTQAAGVGGSMSGRFYGPSAEEFGGPFSINVNGGTNYAIAGAAAAKR